jgi:TldD protein
MPLDESVDLYARSMAFLPAPDELAARIRDMTVRLKNLRKAPLLDRYNGPVLFEGRAAGEIFSGEFAPALAGRRKTLSGSPEMDSIYGRFLEGGSASFADKLGGRVLPQFLSVVDNPTISKYGNEPLFAGYKVDEEGVRARETRVVENGIQTGTYLEREIFTLYKCSIISKINGGGGGSRTPVRKALRRGAYMLISVPLVSPAALRTSKKRSRLVRLVSPAPSGPKGLGQLTV